MSLKIDFCFFTYSRPTFSGDFRYVINGQFDFKKKTFYIACAILQYVNDLQAFYVNFPTLGIWHSLKYMEQPQN